MGPFSRSRSVRAQPAIVPPGAVDRLPAVGRAIFRDGELGVDVSDYYLPGFLAARSPSPGTPGWDAFTERFLDELLVAGEAAGGWGIAGAFYVANDFIHTDDRVKPLFDEIVNRALAFLSTVGVQSSAIPMFALDRWHEIHRTMP